MTTDKIQSHTTFTKDEIQYVSHAIQEILESGWLILSTYTKNFEQAWCERFGTQHAIAVSSGTAALEIIMRAMDMNGKTVLVPSNTNFATAAAAIYAGAKVSLVDSGLYIDMNDLEAKIADADMLIVVHIGGYIDPNMPKILQLCKEHGVLLIEDAAHSHGASLDGTPAGQFGIAGAFSFFPTKVMTTGEGGLIVTDDADLANKAREYRNQGKGSNGALYHQYMGNSWRMTEIEAAIGFAQLQGLSNVLEVRRGAMTLYHELLQGVVTLPDRATGAEFSGYKCIALLEDEQQRSELTDYLKSDGIFLERGVYEVPLHQQPLFQNTFSTNDRFSLADSFARTHICLPIWNDITPQHVQRVAYAIKQFKRRNNS